MDKIFKYHYSIHKLMFNQKIFLYMTISVAIGSVTSVFQFNSVDAQSGGADPAGGLDTLVIALENSRGTVFM